MLIISGDAAAEAERLASQAWNIDPVILTPGLLTQLTAMDGGVLLDPQGRCHAVGVILDGIACGNENPARGSRYNNAIRYLASEPPPAVVVVYSADGSIDVLPRLNPRIERGVVEQAVQQYLAAAARRAARGEGRAEAWDSVKALQFYLSEEQCRVVNAARAAYDRWLEERGDIRIIEPELHPNPLMDDSYWIS
jgi:hypothetical protein